MQRNREIERESMRTQRVRMGSVERDRQTETERQADRETERQTDRGKRATDRE